ncbi:MAG: GGDEF domain-containing protein [Magnetococcales bacterium]|nr:GGDEF domain-containing protein [Magnetococcales bacterium]
MSLSRILTFDTQFVFETYIGALVSEVENAKQALEGYARDWESEMTRQTLQPGELARLDGLTGLLNQRSFHERSRHDPTNAKRKEKRLCNACFDPNHFIQLDDHCGHLAGDRILAQVRECPLATVRETDTACRHGGDEFVMVLPHSHLESTELTCKRLIECFYAKAEDSGVTFSIGLAETGPDIHYTPDEMVTRADNRTYRAKEGSRSEAGFWRTTDGKPMLLFQPVLSGHLPIAANHQPLRMTAS